MTSNRALLLIADIGGYTNYMSTHRMSLAHAQVNTTRLLEKVVRAARGFDLIEIEGDAAFLSRRADALDPEAAVAEVLRAATSMHQAFHVERQYVATNLCPCKGCAARNLKLKFVAHVGEVATQTIRRRRKLVGFDVILAHRLLKNPVPVPEYILVSDDLYQPSESALSDAVEISHELEGIGEVRAFYVDLEQLDGTAPLPARPGLGARLGRTLQVAGAGLPLMLGLRRSAPTP